MTIDSGMQTDCSRPTPLAGLLGRTRIWLLTCGERRRQRNALAAFDDRMLADLGLSRSDVSSEVGKWPWQG